MSKVLIIGANGFVGPYLAQEFVKAGHTVSGYDMPELNILDEKKLNEIINAKKPDYLINLAAISSVAFSWENPNLTIDVNLNGSLNILNAIQTNAPKCKVLLVGSSEEYALKDSPLNEDDPLNATNPYGISKIAQENFADLYRKKYGLNIICTRSFNHTGVGQKETFAIPSFCKQVVEIEKTEKPGKIYVGNLSAHRDISDVRDIAHVYRMLLENENKYNLYNVGSGITHTMQEILDYIISLSSVTIEIIQDASRMRPVENPYICCDNTRIKEYWGGNAIEETIQGMVKWYREGGNG